MPWPPLLPTGAVRATPLARRKTVRLTIAYTALHETWRHHEPGSATTGLANFCAAALNQKQEHNDKEHSSNYPNNRYIVHVTSPLF